MKLIVALATPILVLAMSSVYAGHSSRDEIKTQINHLLRIEVNDRYRNQVGYHHRYESHSGPKFRGRGRKKLPRRINPPGERIFVFSPRLKAWAAYSPNGKRVGYGRANGGANWCAEIGRPCRTPVGVFRVRSKGSAGCRSRKYPLPRGGAPMPYCMFFLSAYAIHGSPGISNYNSSHGCIRVQNKAAYWLSNYFMKRGTRVVVVSY